MSLLEAVVLLDVVEVVSTDDNGPLHLHALHHPGEDPPPDAHVSREWTLLVDVRTLSCLRGTSHSGM